MARAAKPKKEISMEEALWKSADNAKGVNAMKVMLLPHQNIR